MNINNTVIPNSHPKLILASLKSNDGLRESAEQMEESLPNDWR